MREREREREDNKTTKNVVHLLLLDRIGSVGIAWIATVRICLSLQLMLRLLQLLLFHLIDIHTHSNTHTQTHRHTDRVYANAKCLFVFGSIRFSPAVRPRIALLLLLPHLPISPSPDLPLFLALSLLPSHCASLASLCRYALVPTTQSSNRFNAILCNFEAALPTSLPAGDCAVSRRDSISS